MHTHFNKWSQCDTQVATSQCRKQRADPVTALTHRGVFALTMGIIFLLSCVVSLPKNAALRKTVHFACWCTLRKTL